MADFGEDVVVSMRKYYWSKKEKSVIKRGAKRKRESSTKQMPPLSHVLWKSDTPDIKQGALDTTTSMGVFVGVNYDSISQLSVILTDKEQELQKTRLDLAAAEEKHE